MKRTPPIKTKRDTIAVNPAVSKAAADLLGLGTKTGRVVTGRPSILEEVATATASRRWDFTPAQRADVDEVFAAIAAGRIQCGCARLARILKARYAMPQAASSIRDRLQEIKAHT